MVKVLNTTTINAVTIRINESFMSQ